MKITTRMRLLGKAGAMAKKRLKTEASSEESKENNIYPKDIHAPVTLPELEHEVEEALRLEDNVESDDDSDDDDESFAIFDDIESTTKIDGSRIINMSNLCDFIDKIAKHMVICTKIPKISFYSEKKSGLASKTSWKCACGIKIWLRNSDMMKLDGGLRAYEVNYRSVIGTIQCGSGHKDAACQFGLLGVPFLTKKHFIKIESHIGNRVREEANKSFTKWIGQIREKAIENNQISDLGSPSFAFVTDAGWSRRSYKHSYRANSAALPIIEVETKKLSAFRWPINFVLSAINKSIPVR